MHSPVSLNSLTDNGVTDINSQQNCESSKESDEVQTKRQKLQSWINKYMKIEMTDGRILIGMFMCSDRDGNVILGSCNEFLNPEVCGFSDEPRLLGLVMVPGRHIVKISCEAQSGPRVIP